MTDIARLGMEIDSSGLRDGQRELRNLADEGAKAEASTRKSMQDIGKSMTNLGKSLSLKVTAPITAFGGLALRTAGNFEQAMNSVAAISGAAGDELEALRDVAKDLGSTTQFSASQAADAMGFLAMAGFDANQTMEALPGTLQLAAAAGLDLASSADTVSNILSGYGKEISELSHINDVLVATFTSANTDLQQLGEAMKYAGPVASAAGVSFEEAAAAIGLMGNAGIQGSMAGTSLRGALARMLNPTKQAAGTMEELGIALTDAAGRVLPLGDVLDQLAPHAEDAGLMMELFGQRAGPAMSALLSQGGDALRELTGELEAAGGSAERIAAVQMEGFNGQMRALRSAFEGLQIAIGESGLLEFATSLVERFAGMVRGLSDLNPAVLNAGSVIAGLAAVVGPLLIGFGMMASAVGAAIGPLTGIAAIMGGALKVAAIGLAAAIGTIGLPITLAVAGVVALTAAMIAFWPEIKAAGAAVLEFAEAAREGFLEFYNATVEHIAGAVEWIQTSFTELLEWFGELPQRFFEFGRNMVQGLLNGFNEMWEAFKENIREKVDWIPDWIKRRLGIASPSKVFHEIGMNIGQGLTNGINDSFGMVRAAVQGLGDQVTSGAFDMASGVVDAMGQMFQGSKPIAAAQALINTFQGITEALKLPFPANLAAAARVAAQGFAAVRGIQSARPGSSGGISRGASGGSGASGGAASQAPAPPTQTVVIDAPGLDISSLVNMLNNAAKQGYQLQVQTA